MINCKTWSCALRASGGECGCLFSGVRCAVNLANYPGICWLAGTGRADDVVGIIDLHREMTALRPFRPIPL
jgi:hypothetical protein